MKKNYIAIIFIIICLVFCAIPFVGMVAKPSNEPIGNEILTQFPSLKNEDGSFNTDYLQQAGDYFSTHYFKRPAFISTDAFIQSKLFGVSNLDSVIVGKNDWLYYSSTLDNYLGRNLMSERAVFNTVNNLRITDEYLSERGTGFVFTVAPNKNTLYPENMPYYLSKKESENSNLKAFTDMIKETDVNYCDLYEILSSEKEILYHIQDSHWNNKGAMIAYNSILDSVDKNHDDYSSVKVTRSKNFNGDLGNMIYPDSAEPEYNYDYEIEWDFSYITPTKSVEEPIISTENSKAEDSLYMYRDSFGNAVLPFFANAYNSATFTKMFPVNLTADLEGQNTDTVVFLIAERNLKWFAEKPPVVPSEETDDYEIGEEEGNIINPKAEISLANMKYVSVSGEVESNMLKNDSEFIVCIRDEDGFVGAFDAFTTSCEDSDFAFTAYVPKEYFSHKKLDISVIIKNGTEFSSTASVSTEIQEPEI